MRTLLKLRTKNNTVFDGSVKGNPVKLRGNISILAKENMFNIKKGYIDPGPVPDMAKCQSFTVEATILPKVVDGSRQNIIESQLPPIALFLDDKGFVWGSVHIKGEGWKSVKSSSKLVQGKEYHVIFSRDNNSKLILEIGGNRVGEKSVNGLMDPVGKKGFLIGTAMDGKNYQFSGKIGNVQIRDGSFTAEDMKNRISYSKSLALTIKAKLSPNANVYVNPSLDESHRRLQPIKDIMNAAGIEKISDLSTLRITVPTTMSVGKVLVAAKKSSSSGINWGSQSGKFKGLTALKKKDFLAKYMTNRNSAHIIKKAHTDASLGIAPISSVSSTRFSGRIDSLGSRIRTGLRIPREVIAANPTLEALKFSARISDFIRLDKPDLTVLNKDKLLGNLESNKPEFWLQLGQMAKVLRMQTLPVNSSVIIAGKLDLTNTQLIIEPDVEKLYIIAEEVVCGNNCKITWRRPGGNTPPRLDDPELNGRNFSNTYKPGSRDGCDGTNGRSGNEGINGAAGRVSPSIEMWVKNLTNIPSVDLNGEDGINGGRGQKGGRGGNGSKGKNGKYRWIWTPFGNIEWCDTNPGDGGDGGDGGRGGNGGKGGDGGDGGKIIIGVLDGTLAATATAGQFQWKNQGGQKGDGGHGGTGGYGGSGGSRGSTSHCSQADNGHNGSQGQPGSVGREASKVGNDGMNEFFEFTEDAWDEMLTRPWISEVNPSEVFPGNTITIRGSRFANNDRVIIVGGPTLVPTINADESLSVTIPINISGGTKSIFVRRSFDNTESNHAPIYIKPQLDTLPASLPPMAQVTITGRAFLSGASVMINSDTIPGVVNSAGTEITFQMIGTGGAGSSGGSVIVTVRNPDGLLSNSRTALMPRILEIPFTFGIHNLPFGNFTDGVPTWGTFEDTFGTAEVWHELLDPIFGHPILTGAFYGFYHYFLKGEANGGLATGFCTSLSCLVAEKLWQGINDAHTTTKASTHSWLTAVHGKLLSRESLIHFHDQGQQGLSRVELTARAIERTFLTGCDRNVAPLLFFIPSGSVWDAGYFDALGGTHCIMPYRFEYPPNHAGPVLSANGLTTISSLDGVKMYCWDCNNPESSNCRLEFRVEAGNLHFSYFPDGALQFDSTLGLTLGHWTNGGYCLADHDLPFSGPFGLTSFIIDFLLSPADLEITNEDGLRVGNFNNMIYSEIPDSHPSYLLKGAYLLPVGHNLTRRIVGNGAGNYTFNSLMPDGTTIKLEGVPTNIGHRDTLVINNDASQVRFTPHEEKSFDITFSKEINGQIRALSISGIGGGPGTDIDITVAPDLSIFRLGNRSAARSVTVKAFSIDKVNNTPVNNNDVVSLPNNHDLVITVSDWGTVNLHAEALDF